MMQEADIALTQLPQVDGEIKNRPVLLLRKLPPFGDYLVCGISTQLRHYVSDFDELIVGNNADFVQSGLISDSLIRLGFLAVLPVSQILGTIGSISSDRHRRLLVNLSRYLVEMNDE